MKYPWLAPGVEIICVDAWFERPSFRPLSNGGRYIVSSVVPCRLSRTVRSGLKRRGSMYWGSALGVHLIGIGPFKIAFAIERFRPAAPSKTDHVEELKKLCEPNAPALVDQL